jgi:DNA-binding Lrp family transcriptional regulator
VIQAYVLIEAEPTRVQDLIKELPNMELDGSVIKQVHAVTGRYDLIAFVESPDLQSLGNCITTGIAGAVGVRRTETCLVVW